MKPVLFICNEYKVSELKTFVMTGYERTIRINSTGNWFSTQLWIWKGLNMNVSPNGIKRNLFVPSLPSNRDWTFDLIIDKELQQQSWYLGVYLLPKKAEHVKISKKRNPSFLTTSWDFWYTFVDVWRRTVFCFHLNYCELRVVPYAIFTLKFYFS